MKTYILVVIVILGVLASACSPAQAPTAAPTTSVPTAARETSTRVATAAPPTSTPTEALTLATSIEDLVGTWHAEGFRVYLRFTEDGTVHYARALESLDAEPYATAQIRFEGTQMFMKEVAVSGVPSCGEAEVVYEVQLLSSGNIQIVEIDDPCRPRAGDTALEFQRVP